MKYFELTENIGDVEVVFRVLSGIGLLGVTLLGYAPFIYSTIFPMMGAYFVLTAIMRWDPIGFAIQVIFRVLGQLGSKVASRHPAQHIKPI